MGFYPEIRLKIDKVQEKANILDFIENNIENHCTLEWFFPFEIQFLFSQNFSREERKKNIGELIEYTYEKKNVEIEAGLAKTRQNWEAKQNDFFSLMDKIFGAYPWPANEYRGILTIFRRFNRYVNSGKFFFPYKYHNPKPFYFKYADAVIAHELMHFLFIDYLGSRFSGDSGVNIKPEDGLIEDLAEAFNAVIENWQPYCDIFNNPRPPYKDNEQTFHAIKQIWENEPDVGNLFENYIKERICTQSKR